MRYTSAEAAKLLRKLNEERDSLEQKEFRSRTFCAAVGENVESVRPDYDYKAMQEALNQLDEKIRRVKHAISAFNLNHVVPEFGMSIDQLLIYIPQLNRRKQKLYGMQNRLSKQRETSAGAIKVTSIIDYNYANYDIDMVKADYVSTADELARAQTALDVINSCEMLEIDI